MDETRLDREIYIAGLIKKSLFDELSDSEKNELEAWKIESDENLQFFGQIKDGKAVAADLLILEQYNTEAATKKIFSQTGLVYTEGFTHTYKASISQMKIWKLAAAAVLLFAISGATFFLINKRETKNIQASLKANAKIIPGGNKAILTLSDGSNVILDSANNGLISNQGNSKVLKLADGQLAYNAISAGAQVKPVYNTLTTPKGGQYQITLPDGTDVWLNSASSITFPTYFAGNERLVKITGEVYFEVKSIVSRTALWKIPFVVHAANQKISVLGTHFNINAYDDEDVVRTTLVEGSVKVSNTSASVFIEPGEQAMQINSENTYRVVRPNLEEVLAWKNGKFIFKNASAKSIMLQLSRWYDIDINYKDDLSGIYFSGGLSRKNEIEKLIELLALDGRVKFELKGRQLIVKLNK